MPFLRIPVTPTIISPIEEQQALAERKGLLDDANALIVAQNIADLEIRPIGCMRIVLFASGPPEAIATLKAFLNQRKMQYEACGVTTADADDPHAEGDNDKGNPTTGQ